MAYLSHKYLTTLGGKSLVVGRMPFASRKARSVFSQQRKVSGLTPAARESSIFVRDFIRIMNFELGIMRFGLSILLNKSLLVGTFARCGDVTFPIRASLHHIFPMQFSDIKPIFQPYFSSHPFYWLLKCNYHIFNLLFINTTDLLWMSARCPLVVAKETRDIYTALYIT